MSPSSSGADAGTARSAQGPPPSGSGADDRNVVQEELDHLRGELDRANEALRELNRIGIALMSERDPDRLLGLILTQARKLTRSDAGSLYLVVDGEEEGEPNRLHFLRAQNDSIPGLPEPDFTLPLDETSVAGYAALTADPLVIDDAYRIPEDAPYSFNRGFDEEYGYRAKSMLVAPMIDHRGRVVGVLQLINRKRDSEARIRGEEDAEKHVIPYSEQDVDQVQSLAGQAAVSIENGRLYQEIENLFEGFITAAVTAIDQRDPATSGHSVRVTELTCGLAEVVSDQGEGPFADVSFSREEMKQLRYAGLLHDFGKVGVREEVLTKRKKLPPESWARIESRFQRVREVIKARFEMDRADRLESRGNEGYDAWLGDRRARLEEDLARIDRYWTAVTEANEPKPLPEEGAEILDEVHGTTIRDLSGEEIELLTDKEIHYLQIRRGSLDEEEMKQIQSHVLHGFHFLQEIPWTEELSRVADIMIGHHEKLTGEGYPHGVEGDAIPLETRMMTVADIFDALTAADRPYKKAMPVERALEILRMEAAEGALDADLVDLFVESGVYERVLDTDWREL
ncbi:MAG: HD domain-containing phosphohydrolase [Longimicrobiales bacterium]|nr:HD domain-containing phosphohydrolase [Longimicrobiales bacterium]